MSSALGLNDTLTPGQSLFSPNGANTNGKGQSFARMQDDGNFVVYVQGGPTWASNTNQ